MIGVTMHVTMTHATGMEAIAGAGVHSLRKMQERVSCKSVSQL